MSNQIKISAVVCSYNRAKFISGALDSLAKQSLSKENYEIIIVNNNSTDSTESISKIFIEVNPDLNIKYVIERNQGLSFARNRGINESSSEIIAFIDDDGIAQHDFLKIAVEFFAGNSEIDAIGGKVIPVYESGKEPEWLSKYIWGLVTKVDWGDSIRAFPGDKYPAGCNMIFRKMVLIEVGYFNTDLKLRSDDKYIFGELKKAEKRFLYLPQLIVHHHIDSARTEINSVKRISNTVGASERVRLRNAGFFPNIVKLAEYLAKLGAALIIAFGFLFTGDFSKAVYIMKNRWWTLTGFFKDNL